MNEVLSIKRAHLFSLGGCILLSSWLLSVMMFVAVLGTNQHTPLLILVGGVCAMLTLYSWISSREELVLRADSLSWSAPLQSKELIPLADVCEVRLVHEGLNMERGILRLTFHYADKTRRSIALGPCWRRHELEEMLLIIERHLSSCKLVEHIR